MELATLLEQKRKAILGQWFQLVIETYPRATSNFLAKQQDQFRNPVGHASAESHSRGSTTRSNLRWIRVS